MELDDVLTRIFKETTIVGFSFGSDLSMLREMTKM